mgnify:CR=1 FL=1
MKNKSINLFTMIQHMIKEERQNLSWRLLRMYKLWRKTLQEEIVSVTIDGTL